MNIIDYRRHLHSIPELGRQEQKTREYLLSIIKTLTPSCEQQGIQVSIQDGFSTGFWVDLRHNNDKFIAFRADMDALPAQDLSQCDFKSTHAGVSHNCGHDTHMAVALGLITDISTGKVKPRCNVRVIFQPSEEMFVGGAKGMIEAGCLENVSHVYGLHNDPTVKSGSIAICPGVIMAAGDQFKITIEGRSTHGSTPHLGLDALGEAVRLVNEFKSMVSNEIAPNEMKLLTVCTMNAGTASNIIANHAEFEGSFRSFKDEIQVQLKEKILHLVNESNARGFKTVFSHRGYPAVINNPSEVDRIIEKCNQLGVNVIHCQPLNGSEDYSYYLQHKPGAFFFLGSGNDTITNPIHSNPFYIDESCLQIGVDIFASLIS